MKYLLSIILLANGYCSLSYLIKNNLTIKYQSHTNISIDTLGPKKKIKDTIEPRKKKIPKFRYGRDSVKIIPIP
jgi:hypothetical protein